MDPIFTWSQITRTNLRYTELHQLMIFPHLYPRKFQRVCRACHVSENWSSITGDCGSKSILDSATFPPTHPTTYTGFAIRKSSGWLLTLREDLPSDLDVMYPLTSYSAQVINYGSVININFVSKDSRNCCRFREFDDLNLKPELLEAISTYGQVSTIFH